MVLGHNLLDGVMTLITFTDGNRVIFKDDKVATESECCCCCLVVKAYPNVVGMYQDAWDNCFNGMWNTIKQRLEAAGYVVTITLGVGFDPDGNPLVAPSMEITSSCCFDCESLAGVVGEAWLNNGAITGQAAGAWADIQSLEVFNTPCGGLQWGTFTLAGCCDQFCLPGNPNSCEEGAPFSVNGVGDTGSQWLPVCNPLP